MWKQNKINKVIEVFLMFKRTSKKDYEIQCTQNNKRL